MSYRCQLQLQSQLQSPSQLSPPSKKSIGTRQSHIFLHPFAMFLCPTLFIRASSTLSAAAQVLPCRAGKHSHHQCAVPALAPAPARAPAHIAGPSGKPRAQVYHQCTASISTRAQCWDLGQRQHTVVFSAPAPPPSGIASVRASAQRQCQCERQLRAPALVLSTFRRRFRRGP